MKEQDNEAQALAAASEVVEKPRKALKDLPPKQRRREIARRAENRAAARREARKNDAANLSEDEREAIIQRRTENFIKLFDRIEAEQLTEQDVKAISIFATTQYHVRNPDNQNLDDLSALKVEPEAMSEFEYVAIVKKANFALNTILSNRSKYVGGQVFWTNRHMKRATAKRILKGREKARLQYDVTTVTKDKDGNETGRTKRRVVTGTKVAGRGGSRRKSAIPSRAVAEMKERRIAVNLVGK